MDTNSVRPASANVLASALELPFLSRPAAMEWLGSSQEQARFEGKYAEEEEQEGGGKEEGEAKEEVGERGEAVPDAVFPSPSVADPFGLNLFSDDSGSQEEDTADEWEDTYDRSAHRQQQSEKPVGHEASAEVATAAADAMPAAAHSLPADAVVQPMESDTASVIDLVSCEDDESDAAAANAAVSTAGSDSQSCEELFSSSHSSRKRRRLFIDDPSQPPLTDCSSPSDLSPAPQHLPPPLTSCASDHPPQQPTTVSAMPPVGGAPFDQWCSELLAQLDEDLQLHFENLTDASSEARPWSPPAITPLPLWPSIFPPPPSLPSTSALPFPRPLRPVQPLSASALSPLLPDSSNAAPPLLLSDSVCLFGDMYWVDCIPASLPSLFERLESTLLSLHCGLLECPLPAFVSNSFREDVATFLSFMRSYLTHALPLLSALHRSLFLFVLETCCMLLCERMLVMRLPALTASGSFTVQCDVLHTFLVVHAHILHMHAVLVAHRGASSTPVTISLPVASPPSSDSSSSAATLSMPHPASRWVLSSYLIYLLLDLLSLHQRFPSIGRLKPHEAAQLNQPSNPHHQTILSLWHTIISYTDHLHTTNHTEHNNNPAGAMHSSTTDEYYCRLFSQQDVLAMESVSSQWDAIELAPGGGGGGWRADESEWMNDVEDESVFPCFYHLLNSVLVPFLTDPLFSGPPSPSSSLLLSLHRQPLSHAECYVQCGVQGADIVLAVSREQMCDRVEVLWEVLMDCIIPAYTLPPLVPGPPSSSTLPFVRPVDVPALCASYSLYDTLSDLDTSQAVSMRCCPSMADEQCACRPHWSLLSFLLRVGLHHVSPDYRHSYPTTILSRLSSIVHVWPCIDADRLMLSLYQLADLSATTTPASLMSQPDSADDFSEERLECWPGSLLDDDVHIALTATGSDKRWQQYLRVMFVYLRLMAEAKPAPSPIAFSPPSCTLQHNNSSHHTLLFHSHNTLPRVLSSLYLLFQSPSPPPRFTCDGHGQLERLSQQVSVHLLAALVSAEAAGRAASHLNRLMDFDGSCYHAQSFMLRCWSALATILIKHSLPLSDTLRGFLRLLSQSIQLHMDAEEDAEVLQCEVWNEPREWSDELKREKQRELRALRDQLRYRRKRLVFSLGLLRRLMQRRFAVDGCVEADYLTMLGVSVGGGSGGGGGSGSSVSQSFLFELLDVERPVPLSVRMAALKLVEDTLLCLQVPASQRLPSTTAPATSVNTDVVIEQGSQESDEGELVQLAEAVQLAEQQRALSRRRESIARLLPFLDTMSLQLMKRMTHYFSETNQQQAALLLLNPHRTTLQAAITTHHTTLAAYTATKRTHRTTKAYHRRPTDNAVDDAYRISRDLLLLCTRLHGEMAHVLIQARPGQAAVAVKEFGVVVDVQAMEKRQPQLRVADVGLFRYRFLLSYQAFLDSNAYDRAVSIQALLKAETDRAALVRSLLCALTESDELDMPREALVVVLRRLLPLPHFLPYQRPAVDVLRVCANLQSLQQSRAEIIDSLVVGTGSLVSSTSSFLSSPSDIPGLILSPAFFAHLTQQMTQIVDTTQPQRISAAEPPTLSPAATAHLTLLYHTVDHILLHCTSLLRPTPRNSVQLLDELVATWVDAVLPSSPAAAPAGKGRLGYGGGGLGRYCGAHRLLAERLWCSVVWCVSEMGVSPMATVEWPDRLRGLVALTKREAFWPHNAGVNSTTHSALAHSLWYHSIAPTHCLCVLCTLCGAI